MHGRDLALLDALTSSWRGSENLRAAFPFMIEAANGLAGAYIATQDVSSSWG